VTEPMTTPVIRRFCRCLVSKEQTRSQPVALLKRRPRPGTRPTWMWFQYGGPEKWTVAVAKVQTSTVEFRDDTTGQISYRGWSGGRGALHFPAQRASQLWRPPCPI
jgi:hypothetical protein